MLILDCIETSIADKSMLIDLQRNLNMSCVYMMTISSIVADKCPAEVTADKTFCQVLYPAHFST